MNKIELNGMKKDKKESMQHAKSIAYSNRRDINPILFTPNAMEWFLWHQQYKIQFYARPHFTSASFFFGGNWYLFCCHCAQVETN